MRATWLLVLAFSCGPQDKAGRGNALDQGTGPIGSTDVWTPDRDTGNVTDTGTGDFVTWVSADDAWGSLETPAWGAGDSRDGRTLAFGLSGSIFVYDELPTGPVGLSRATRTDGNGMLLPRWCQADDDPFLDICIVEQRFDPLWQAAYVLDPDKMPPLLDPADAVYSGEMGSFGTVGANMGGDINGDGHEDLIVMLLDKYALTLTHTADLWPWAADPFSAPEIDVTFVPPSETYEHWSTIAKDLDGDGVSEFVSVWRYVPDFYDYDSWETLVTVHDGPLGPIHRAADATGTISIEDDVYAMEPADLDGDGQLELMLYGAFFGLSAFPRPYGDLGSEDARWRLTASESLHLPALADLNADGHLDLSIGFGDAKTGGEFVIVPGPIPPGSVDLARARWRLRLALGIPLGAPLELDGRSSVVVNELNFDTLENRALFFDVAW